MKHYGLWLTTVGAILLTGLVLRGAGWSGRAHRAALSRPAHSWAASAAWHSRQGQAPHFSSLHYLLRAAR
jgi:hypothetical protein